MSRIRACEQTFLSPELSFYCTCTPLSVQSMCQTCFQDHLQHDYYICDSYDGVCYCAELNGRCEHKTGVERDVQLDERQLAELMELSDEQLRRASGRSDVQNSLLRHLLQVYHDVSSNYWRFQLAIENKRALDSLDAVLVRKLFLRKKTDFDSTANVAVLYSPDVVLRELRKELFQSEKVNVRTINACEEYRNFNDFIYEVLDIFQHQMARFGVLANQLIKQHITFAHEEICDILRSAGVVVHKEDELLLFPQFMLLILTAQLRDYDAPDFPHDEMRQLVTQLVQNYEMCVRIHFYRYKRNSEDLQQILAQFYLNGTYKFSEAAAFYCARRYCYYTGFWPERISAAAAYKMQRSDRMPTPQDAILQCFLIKDYFYLNETQDANPYTLSTAEFIATVGRCCEHIDEPFSTTRFYVRKEFATYDGDFLLQSQVYRDFSLLQALENPLSVQYELYDDSMLLKQFYSVISAGAFYIEQSQSVQSGAGFRRYKLRKLVAGKTSSELAISEVSPSSKSQLIPTGSDMVCDLCHEVMQKTMYQPVSNVTEIDSLQRLNLWVSCGHRLHLRCLRNFSALGECPVCHTLAQHLICLRNAACTDSGNQIFTDGKGSLNMLYLPQIQPNDQLQAYAIALSFVSEHDVIPDAQLMANNIQSVLQYAHDIGAPEPCPASKLPRVAFKLPTHQHEFLDKQCTVCGVPIDVHDLALCALCGAPYHVHCGNPRCGACGGYFWMHPGSMTIVNYESQATFRAPYRNFLGEVPKYFFGEKFSLDCKALAMLTAYCQLGYYKVRGLAFKVKCRTIFALNREQPSPTSADSSSVFEEVQVDEV